MRRRDGIPFEKVFVFEITNSPILLLGRVPRHPAALNTNVAMASTGAKPHLVILSQWLFNRDGLNGRKRNQNMAESKLPGVRLLELPTKDRKKSRLISLLQKGAKDGQ